MRASDFFTTGEKEQLKQCILEAEQKTSGEIRIHVELYFNGEVLDRAATVFARLNMHKTELRNGVLIYFAIHNKQYAILGDTGINRVVPENFWNNIKEAMNGYFIDGHFAQGLCRAVTMAGEQLKEKFPRQPNDINELPNEISFDQGE